MFDSLKLAFSPSWMKFIHKWHVENGWKWHVESGWKSTCDAVVSNCDTVVGAVPSTYVGGFKGELLVLGGLATVALLLIAFSTKGENNDKYLCFATSALATGVATCILLTAVTDISMGYCTLASVAAAVAGGILITGSAPGFN
jgi:hypothetical protein